MSIYGGNMFGGMGGMGGMPMGGMGGNSTTMMSSAMAASVSMSILAAGAYWYYTKNNSTDGKKSELQDETPPASVVPVTANLDGAKLITVGGISMRVEGESCGNGKVLFASGGEKATKWVWNLQKAGDWSGNPYYTIESYYKNFNFACEERFLTAAKGCKSPPYLAKRQYGPQQHWLIVGDETNGYQLRNLSCALDRYDTQYLMKGTSEEGGAPRFSGGSGSRFVLQSDTNT